MTEGAVADCVFLRGSTVFARTTTIHNVVLAVHIAERLALKFAVGERLSAKAYDIFASWNKDWNVVCI